MKKKNHYLLIIKDHANNILAQINIKKSDQYSLLNLTFFSCALDIDDKNKIINLLLDNLKNDLFFSDFLKIRIYKP